MSSEVINLTREELLSRISVDPNVCFGKPCIRGTRVTVSTLIGLLSAGRPVEEILQAYPYLQEPDVRAALAFAARQMEAMDVSLAS